MCLGVGALGSLLLRMTEMCCWRGRLCPAAPVVLMQPAPVVLVAAALRLETRAAAAPPAPPAAVALAPVGSVAVGGRLLVGMCR